MPAHHGPVRPGGLRREHLVAAALVAATTIVLGFASGFGVIDAGAAGNARSGPDSAATAAPRMPQAGPAAPGAPPARAVPRGRPVGVLPGSHHGGAPSPAAGSAAETPGGFSPGFGFAETPGSGHLPIYYPPPTPGGAPGTGPAGPAAPASAPQCPRGILDRLLSLLAQMLGGTQPAAALVNFGAPPLTALPLTAPLTEPAATPAAAGPAAAGQAAGQAAEQGTAGPELLAPLGMPLNPDSGSGDPLLIPVLNPPGCGALVSPVPPGAGQ